MQIAGIELTHPDKVLYPDDGITKLDVARHFERVGERMLPFVKDRPLTLVRCPDGIDGDCFFNKHVSGDPEPGISVIEVPEKAGTGRYRGLDDVKGLVSFAQLGALEVHLHGARKDRLDRPDRMIFDLDPGPGLGFADVIAAARRMKGALEHHDLESFVMTTGGKGLHVVVPIERRHPFDAVRAFAHAIVDEIAADEPDRYVAEAAKEKREGKLFLDYLRNSGGATAIAPYSTRARPGATVATPLRWDELSDLDSAGAYRLDNLERRLAALRNDPWSRYHDVRQRLSGAGT